MRYRTSARWALAGLALAFVLPLRAGAAPDAETRPPQKKPDVVVRASPMFGFAPAKVQFLAILQGGDDDYQEYYCPAIEWDWDDETISESSPDCDPYEPGHSRITRRYAASHVFQQDGRYEVKFKLKRKNDVLVLTSVTVQVQPG
jgi:hypothetical protein